MHSRFHLCATLLVAALASLAPFASGQSAATDPVGFVTLSIPGTGGAATNAISFKSLGLVQPISYQGSAETVSLVNKTLTDNDAIWADNQFNGANGAFYIEIVRPAGQLTAAPGEGTTYDIVATNSATKTITLSQNLDATIVNGTNFKIRKHWTLGALFGTTNTAGFLGSGGSSTADQIQVWNGTGYDLYFYQIATAPLGGTGWRSQTDTYADASGTVIFPDDGIIFRLLQNNPVNVVIMGAVKTGTSSFPVSAGFNILANVYAAPMTLGRCGLQTSGFTGASSPSTSDQVLLWNGTGYDIFFYQIATGPLGGTGWRSTNDAYGDASATAIPSGAAIIVKRLQPSAFNWVIPQHPATL